MAGITIRTSPIRSVAFVCPHCGVDRDGDVVDRRRWLTLGRLTVLPLGRLDPMVECGTCGQCSGLVVLNVPTSNQLEEMLGVALRHAVTSVIRAGRGVGPPNDEVDRYAVSVVRSAGFTYDRFDLDDDLRQLRDTGTVPFVRSLADELTLHGKQSMLHRLHTLATTDGPLRPAQREVLVRIGVALGMGPAYINGIIAVADGAQIES